MKTLITTFISVVLILTATNTIHAEIQMEHIATIDVGPDWGHCKDLAASSQHLYVGVYNGTGKASDPAALLVYDISDLSPTGESPVGTAEIPGGCVYDIEIFGGLAYLSHEWFSIVDISDPHAPSLLCYYNQANPPTPYQTAFVGVDVSGDYAFITDAWQGFSVLDTSLPCPIASVAGPLQLNYFEGNVEVWGQTAFIPTAHRPHWAMLIAIDISVPSNPTVIGDVPLPVAPECLSLSEDGQHAYVACQEGGLQVVNINDPTDMELIGSYPLSFTRDVTCEGNLVIVAEDNTVIALDVTNPSTPTLLDSVPLSETIARITMKDSLVYASCQTVGEVVIFRISMIADVDIDPDTLNLSSKDKWITCYIELPEGYDVMDIDGSTVMLESIPAYIGKEGWARAGANTSNIVDHDYDGIPERMVKFDKTEVQDYLIGLGILGDVELVVTGEFINGLSLEGTDVINVINPGKKK